jgi:hypothetical protein
MGYQHIEDIMWPNEQPTWTAGAVLLAADALTDYTGAARLFTSVELVDAALQPAVALRGAAVTETAERVVTG